MWREGVRGNQVSPEPWADDWGDTAPAQTEEPEPENVQPTVEDEWSEPPEVVSEQSPRVPGSKNLDVPRFNGVANGVAFMGVPGTKDEDREKIEMVAQKKDDFVYKPREKAKIDMEIEYKNFNKTHAWTPYLWERKRDMLMKGPIIPSKGLKYGIKSSWKSFNISWNEFLYSIGVWNGSLKQIEGHQGMGVVSYFVFLRWLFFLNIFIFLMLFWIITFFQVTFDNAGYDADVLGSGSTVFTTTTADTCSGEYSPNVSSDALSNILDFVQGTGWMENTAMFYGFYTSQELKLAVSEYNMPLAYFLVAVAVLLVSLIIMVHHTLSNFKDTVLAKEDAKQAAYCNSVFAGLDYSLDEEEAINIARKSVYNGLVADLEEQRHDQMCERRTTGEKCRVYTIRFIINFIIIVMLAGAGAAIYYAQDFSSKFTTSSDVNDYHSLVVLLVEFLPSIVIGLLNGIFPLIFDVLVTFEGYKPALVIKISLMRSVFLRLASLAMVVASLYIQITCSTQTTCLVGVGSCPSIQCWETYVGSAVYKLMLMDFFIDVGVTLGVELPRKLITTKCTCGLLNKIGPAIFDIPKNVLDLVYAQTLCWLGFFFAPLLPALIVIRLFILFYLKKLSAMFNTVPPEKPYHASKSNSFFMIVLMIAYFMICSPVGYTLVKLEPSPMCGPFRIYNKPSDIIDVQIANAPKWFETLWGIVTSAAFVSAVIILLCLAVYYCSALNSAHKDLVDMMKEQMVLEGKDKQFLLNRINELTGNTGNNKTRPPPYDREKARDSEGQKDKLKSVTVERYHKFENKPKNQQRRQQEISLYGKESGLVEYPMNDFAPPPASYNGPTNHKSNGYLDNQYETRTISVASSQPRSRNNGYVDEQEPMVHVPIGSSTNNQAIEDW